jgi:ABC-type dipeptide/oligopeptide/nickel transport system permease subunit
MDLQRIVFPSDVWRAFRLGTRRYVTISIIGTAISAVFFLIAALAAAAAHRLGVMSVAAILAAAAPAFYLWMVFASVLGSFRRNN